MKGTLGEIVGGPATLLVYAVAAIGAVVLLVGDDADFAKYLDLLDQLAIPLAGLAAGRGVMVGLRGK